MNKYLSIIFDFDGTIADTKKSVLESVEFALASVNVMGKVIGDDVIGPSPYYVYHNIFGLDDVTAKKAVDFHRRYSEEKAYQSAELYPNVVESLKVLKQQGLSLHIVSLKKESVLLKILKKFNILELFNSIVGITSNEFVSKKELLESFIEKEQLNNVIYVGDTQGDYLACKALNIDFCFAKYGFGSILQRPLFVISSFPQIIDVVLNKL